MNLKVWLRFLLLLLLLAPASAYSQKQKKSLVMYHDPVTGQDTILFGAVIDDRSAQDMQYEIKYHTSEGKIFVFKAKDIQGYREHKKMLYSRVVQVNGEKRHVLLPRMYEKDSVYVYSFIGDDGKRRPYVQIGNSIILKPLADETDADLVNPEVMAYIKSFPVAADDRVGAYIDAMKPTVASLEKRHQVCRTGNANYITRFRWGVLLGGGLGKVVMDDFRFDNKLQGFAGVFADVPVYESVSIRPELTFRPYGYKGNFPTEEGQVNAVYNRKDVSAALLIRYTFRSFTGRWLPFALVGPQFDMALTKEMESAERWTDEEGFTVLDHHVYAMEKGMSLGVTGGVGVEYVVSPRHSLFFDLRYSHGLADESLRGICFILSFNL